jgi:hypothetical protein
MSENDVRELLAQVAELAPTTLDPRPQRRHPASWVAMVAAAAAVLAVAVPLGVLARHDDHPRPVAAQADPARPTPVPPGARRAVFRGLALDVPQQWPDDQTRCGTPTADTVVHADGGFLDCLSRLQPKVTYVEFRKESINGQPCQPAGGPLARCNATDSLGRRVVLLRVPSNAADALVVSPDPGVADRLAATAQIVTQDAGCPVRPAALGPGTSQAASDSLVPGTPDSATVCRWSDGLLARTGRLQGTALNSFVRAVHALRPGLAQARLQDGNPAPGDPRCADEAGRAFRITLHYPARTDHPLWLRLTGCGRVIGFDDGQHTARPSMKAITPILNVVAFDTGFPSIE